MDRKVFVILVIVGMFIGSCFSFGLYLKRAIERDVADAVATSAMGAVGVGQIVSDAIGGFAATLEIAGATNGKVTFPETPSESKTPYSEND